MVTGLTTKGVKKYANSLSYLDLCRPHIPSRLELAKSFIKDMRRIGRLVFNMEYIFVGFGSVTHTGVTSDTIYVGRKAIKKQNEMRKLRKSLEVFQPTKTGDSLSYINY